MDDAEKVLRKTLGEEKYKTQESAPDCPTEGELWAYLEGELGPVQEESISRHVAACGTCLESLLLAQEVRPGIGFDPKEGPKEELLRRVRSLASMKGSVQRKGIFRQYRWLFLSLGCIGLSFFLPRYFLQFLLLAALFGVKWIFDSATNRTLIVMYEAWRKKGREKEGSVLRK